MTVGDLAGRAVAAVRPYVPAAQWLPDYDRSWLRRDVLAGLAVWAVLVPQALAYGSLAGLRPEHGLYAAALPLLVYALLGTSRQMSVGPGSAVAILVASTVAPLAAGDPERYIALAAALALLVGLVLIVAGAVGLGFISEFFAKPVLTGFVAGLAVVIIVGQAPKLFGLQVDGGNVLDETIDLVRALPDANGATVIVGLGSLLLLLALNRFAPRRTPSSLITLVVAIAVSSVLDLEAEGVAVIGDVARGLPNLGFPSVGLADIGELLLGAVAIGVVAFAESIATARSFASKHGYEVDANQELIAVGGANLGAGFSQGFAVDGSLSRSASADEAGQKTQVGGLTTFVLLIATLIALMPLFRNLPDATLGALIIVGVLGLIDIGEFRRLYRLDRSDFGLAVVAFGGVLVFGTIGGLFLAVIASLADLTYRAYRPQAAVLGYGDTTDTEEDYRFRDIARHPEYQAFPGLVMYRFGNELFFANARYFSDQVLSLAHAGDLPATEVLVDAGAITYIDTTAQDMLAELVEKLCDDDVRFSLARVTGPARDILQRSGLEELIGTDAIYPTLRAGVFDYLDRHPDARPGSW